ncbi:hypothetical protein QQF64_019535 [Cirrhinus molitorella]|uniref:Uncharacterized protein n=1 Tax=Cirrhinus molitorella TaxID=172907 RepID=A0ABR3LJ33_9TELE
MNSSRRQHNDQESHLDSSPNPSDTLLMDAGNEMPPDGNQAQIFVQMQHIMTAATINRDPAAAEINTMYNKGESCMTHIHH